MEEEWADGAEGFFTEFAESTKGSAKSARKRNREAHEDPDGSRAARAALSEMDRKLSAEEARRKIAAAVVSRASPKELAEARRLAKSSPQARTTTEPRPSEDQRQPGTEGGLGGASFARKKRSKVDEKFARKETRKEEEKAHAIKYRRSLRKRR